MYIPKYILYERSIYHAGKNFTYYYYYYYVTCATKKNRRKKNSTSQTEIAHSYDIATEKTSRYKQQPKELRHRLDQSHVTTSHVCIYLCMYYVCITYNARRNTKHANNINTNNSEQEGWWYQGFIPPSFPPL